jgi:hypothetical protein
MTGLQNAKARLKSKELDFVVLNDAMNQRRLRR